MAAIMRHPPKRGSRATPEVPESSIPAFAIAMLAPRFCEAVMTQMTARDASDLAGAPMIAGAIPRIDVAGYLAGEAESGQKVATQLRWAFVTDRGGGLRRKRSSCSGYLHLDRTDAVGLDMAYRGSDPPGTVNSNPSPSSGEVCEPSVPGGSVHKSANKRRALRNAIRFIRR